MHVYSFDIEGKIRKSAHLKMQKGILLFKVGDRHPDKSTEIGKLPRNATVIIGYFEPCENFEFKM